MMVQMVQVMVNPFGLPGMYLKFKSTPLPQDYFIKIFKSTPPLANFSVLGVAGIQTFHRGQSPKYNYNKQRCKPGESCDDLERILSESLSRIGIGIAQDCGAETMLCKTYVVIRFNEATASTAVKARISCRFCMELF